jgi:hypothetical protein
LDYFRQNPKPEHGAPANSGIQMKRHTTTAKLAALAIATSVLSACGGGGDGSTSAPLPSTDSPAPAPAPAPAPGVGINALLGNVSLRYNFNSSTNVYNDTVAFSASDLSPSGVLAKTGVNGSPSKVIACSYQDGTSPFEGYRYLCVITSNTNLGNADIFWFNVANGTINGRYDYCIGPFTGSACVSDVALGADGPVTGTVTATQTFQSAQTVKAPTLNDEQKATEKRLQKDIERPLSAKQSQLTDRIQQSLEMLNR